MKRRLVIDDGRSERELLVVGTMVVGRDPDCEISANDPRLSRRHAEFRATPTGVVVRDLGSRNGVRVNGQPITETVLASGDVVSLAHLSLRLVDDSQPLALPRTAVAAPVSVTPPGEDDRTRIAPHGGRPRASVASTPPTDVGEIVIRERVAPAAVDVPFVADDPGLGTLVAQGWGRRVLAQGVLLALVAFLVGVVPLLAWQARVFGVSAVTAWPILLAPLVAAVLAGVLVAGLIARSVVRGVRRAGRW